MSSGDPTRRSFLKTSGLAAAALATNAVYPVSPLLDLPRAHPRKGFKLIVEISGLWFLGLHNRTLMAVATGTQRSGRSMLQSEVHHPRIFVHCDHKPCGGQPDKEDALYRRFDITSSIVWPSAVRVVPVTDLPPNITRLDKHTGQHFNPGHLRTSICVPLSFGELVEVFPRLGFHYTDDGSRNCGWGTNVPLAWKLIYYVDVIADSLAMTFPDGSKQDLQPRDEDGTLTLKIKNTTEKHSRARDPLESEDTGADAKHFIMHYDYLDKRPSSECYPVRMKSSTEGKDVSGLYTCMMGGGGS
jgi:hypothetical protein